MGSTAAFMCVCVFSSHSFWTSSSLDVPAGVTQEEGHTGFLIHLPSAVIHGSYHSYTPVLLYLEVQYVCIVITVRIHRVRLPNLLVVS